METAFIVNPKSGNGSTGREWPEIRSKAIRKLGPFREYFTGNPGEATELTRRNLLQGVERIICVGGDGTLNEVINGFMDQNGPVSPVAVLGFIPNGTGCDFARTVDFGRSVDESIETISRGLSRSLDMGRLRYRDKDRVQQVRYFLNIASFGIGGEVADRVNRNSKAAGAFLSFIWATIISIIAYDKKKIRLQVDDLFDEEVLAWNIAVANGRYHGGGMLVAPEARVDDGLFHVTLIGDLGLPSIFLNLPKLYNGRIGELRQVRSFMGAHVVATSAEPVFLDVDGEQLGCLPVEIDIIPGAIRMFVKE